MSDWRGRKVGHYQLVERLGQGGMGVVYRARDTMLDRDVALKMMMPAAGEDTTRAEIAARFFVEAKAAARIQSRHVAQVLQLGETDEGEVYIVMELLVGDALSKVLQTEGRLAPERTVRIARQIARGMQAAHALGVVHRDLKPANVMLVSLDGEDEVVKILDFGVAKLTRAEDQANLTQAGALLGTLPYMAPEQILSKPVDARTDVYALGVVLYRMLAGAPLFDADSLSDVVRNQVQTPAPPFSTRVPGLSVPPTIEAVVLRCLEKDPRKRFASMADLDVALGRALDGAVEPSGPSAIKGRKIEETLPTGTRLPAAAQTALVPVAEETRSALTDLQEEPEPLASAESAVFHAAPSTEPETTAPVARPILPIAAVLTAVVAAVAVAVAVVLVLLVSPEAPQSTPTSSLPPPGAPPSEAPRVSEAPPPKAPPSEAPPSEAPVVDEPAVKALAPIADAVVEKPVADAPKAAPVKPAPAKPAPAKPAPPKPAPPKPDAKKPADTAGEPEAPPGFRRVLTKEGG